MSSETTTITINNYPYFSAKLQALQVKFAKLGCMAPKVIDEKFYRIEVERQFDVISVPTWDITLEYESFSIGGYTFISKIDVTREMYYTAPNCTLPNEQLHFDNQCEHCNTTRDRHTIYVLRNDSTGEYKRIGSSCLAKYIEVNPATILAMSGNYDLFTNLLADDELRTQHTEPDYSLKFVLSIAKFLADRVGFVSVQTAKKDGIASTASYVKTILQKLPSGKIPYSSRNGKIEEYINEILSTDFMSIHADYVAGCIEWMTTQAQTKQNEYTLNIASIAKHGFVISKEISLAVSALIGYNKSLNIPVMPVSNSQYVGNAGDKFTSKSPLIVTCIALSTPKNTTIMVGRGYIEQSTQFYTFVDENDNQYSTYTTTGKVTQGQKVRLTGVIVEQKEFNGNKQTILKNCRMTII